MGPDLAIEERLDTLGKRHAFGVAQIRVGFGITVLVPADRRRLVALGEGGEDGLDNGRGELEPRLFTNLGNNVPGSIHAKRAGVILAGGMLKKIDPTLLV